MLTSLPIILTGTVEEILFAVGDEVKEMDVIAVCLLRAVKSTSSFCAQLSGHCDRPPPGEQCYAALKSAD